MIYTKENIMTKVSYNLLIISKFYIFNFFKDKILSKINYSI